jgi:lipoprotein signal peptidase
MRVNHDDFIVVWIVFLTVIYWFLMWFIFTKRNEYPIYNRSPRLIIAGALGLYLDSVSNVLIATVDKVQFQCFLSIICTLVFHYASYASIFIRGLRIYKVLSYYEDYWTLMKHHGEEVDHTPNK